MLLLLAEVRSSFADKKRFQYAQVPLIPCFGESCEPASDICSDTGRVLLQVAGDCRVSICLTQYGWRGEKFRWHMLLDPF